MPHIKILELPGGKAATSGYFHKNRVAGMQKSDCCIAPGETVEVSDEELQRHLATGMVMVAPAPAKRKPGRPKKSEAQKQADKELAEDIVALQRG